MASWWVSWASHWEPRQVFRRYRGVAGRCHGLVACVQGPELGLMFHSPGLETFNNFLTKGLAFYFALGQSWVVVWGLGKRGWGDISSQVIWHQTLRLEAKLDSILQSPYPAWHFFRAVFTSQSYFLLFTCLLPILLVAPSPIPTTVPSTPK